MTAGRGVGPAVQALVIDQVGAVEDDGRAARCLPGPVAEPVGDQFGHGAPPSSVEQRAQLPVEDLVDHLVAAQHHPACVGAGQPLLRAAQQREVLLVQHSQQDRPVLLPDAGVALRRHPAGFQRRDEQPHLHPAAPGVGRMRPEGEQLEVVVGLAQQRAVRQQEVPLGDVRAEVRIARVLLQEPVDGLARAHHPGVPAEVLHGLHVGVDMLARRVRVRVLDVVVVHERVLHQLPVGRLVEPLGPEGGQLAEPVPGQDLVHLRAQPRGDVDRRARPVDHPDQAVPLLRRQLDQPVLGPVHLAERSLAGDRPQRPVDVVGPPVVPAGEQAAAPALLLLQQRTPVPAHVHEGLHRPIELPRHDHPVSRHLQRDEVVRLGQLAGVGHDRRHPAEHQVPLPLRELTVGVLAGAERDELPGRVGGVVAEVLEGPLDPVAAGGDGRGCHHGLLGKNL